MPNHGLPQPSDLSGNTSTVYQKHLENPCETLKISVRRRRIHDGRDNDAAASGVKAQSSPLAAA
jgi:hypothetical protein